MKRDTKKQYIGTAAGALMGFLLVGLGVVAYESRVKRVMSLKDVQTATLGPVLGTIPVLKSFSGVPTLEMALAEEAIEKSRANILQQFGRTTNRAIVLTSALGDEGHPFMAREMALSFARAGHSTLLVDFDLRTPSLHLDFDLPNEYGFSDVLAGQLELDRAVHALPWGLNVLTAGPLTDVARQNLSAQRLDEVISLCRSVYEIVIINTHPVLTVTETMHAARASDAVILTIDRHQSRLPMVTKAQEKIASLAPEAFGVVYIGATKEECWN
jgi:capsular exopolysaccharide synthesis family protein